MPTNVAPANCAPGNWPKGNKTWAAATGIRRMKKADLHADFDWPDLSIYPRYESYKYLPVARDLTTGQLLSLNSLQADGVTPYFATAADFAAQFCGWLDTGRYSEQLVQNGRAREKAEGDEVMVITEVDFMPLELNTPGEAVRVGDFLAPSIDANTGFLHPFKVEVTAVQADAIAVASKPTQNDECYVIGSDLGCCPIANV